MGPKGGAKRAIFGHKKFSLLFFACPMTAGCPRDIRPEDFLFGLFLVPEQGT